MLIGGLAALSAAALGGYEVGARHFQGTVSDHQPSVGGTQNSGPESLHAIGGDETHRLNTWLAQASPFGIKEAVGTFTISGGLTVPANTYLDASKATFTQTGTGQTSVLLAGGATIVGGAFTGRAADYSPAQNIRPSSIGIRVTGPNAAMYKTTLTDHAGAGIYLGPGSDSFHASLVEISAPSMAIPAMDSACFGVYAMGGTGHTFDQLNIHHVSIGLITSIGVKRVRITGCRLHDIAGQHGIYLQNGTGLVVDRIDAWNIHLHAIKLQLNSASTEDSFACTITNVKANNCGDCAVSINTVTTDLASAKKIRGLSLASIAATRCQRGLYLGSVIGGTITKIRAVSCRGDGITILDCRNLSCSDLEVENCQRVGLRLATAAGAVQDQISIVGLRIQNAGLGGEAGYQFGIYDDQGTNLTLDAAAVSAPAGTMDYGLFVASTSPLDQTTLTVRNCEFLDARTGYDVRLEPGGVRPREWSNNRVSGAVMNLSK